MHWRSVIMVSPELQSRIIWNFAFVSSTFMESYIISLFHYVENYQFLKVIMFNIFNLKKTRYFYRNCFYKCKIKLPKLYCFPSFAFSVTLIFWHSPVSVSWDGLLYLVLVINLTKGIFSVLYFRLARPSSPHTTSCHGSKAACQNIN